MPVAQPILRAFMLVCISIIGCTSDDGTKPDNRLNIREVSIPPGINAERLGDVTLSGKGFLAGDNIKLILLTDVSQSYTIPLSEFDNVSATFKLPNDFATGRYQIVLIRGDQQLILGVSTITIVVVSVIPDVDGMTVKGLVHTNGVGIQGVVVSDGQRVTTTNENGVYYLASEKTTGYVFISVPGNYQVAAQDNIPQFFKRLAGGTAVEQKDFSLVKAANNKHVMLAMSDWQLANRNNDLIQFGNGFLPDVNGVINAYASAGLEVYGLTLGDLTWDTYWYENNFGLVEYLAEMKKVNSTMYNVIGNHDHDPYVQADWASENKYRNVIGPTYYSFNLGEAHYVVLDNIEYVNTGGSPGVLGARDYNDVITPAQIEWLRKDLAELSDKDIPLIIAMHAPLYRTPGVNSSGEQTNSIALDNAGQFLAAIQGFSNVHVLSGHLHTNSLVSHSQAITEYNVGAVCATWWWTGRNGYANNHICKDGSPGGYGVLEVDGRTVNWYYKSIGKPRNYQFRAYDLNKVHITAQAHAPNSTDAALEPYAGAYASPNLNNQVLINVWGFGPGWTIEVLEGSTALQVTRVSAKDPLHIISYEAKRLNVGAVPTEAFVTSNTAHMFIVTASSATSTLQIKVTDRFGSVYTETMQRPKDFTYTTN